MNYVALQSIIMHDFCLKASHNMAKQHTPNERMYVVTKYYCRIVESRFHDE